MTWGINPWLLPRVVNQTNQPEPQPTPQPQAAPQRPVPRPNDYWNTLIGDHRFAGEMTRYELMRRLPPIERREMSSAELRQYEVDQAVEAVNSANDPLNPNNAWRVVTELESQGGNLRDSAQIDELIRRTAPVLKSTVAEASRKVGGESEAEAVLSEFARISERAGDEGVRTLAQVVASNLENECLYYLPDSIEDSIKAGEGARFAVSLVKELSADCKPQAADDVAKATRNGIKHLREEFDKAADKIDELNYITSSFNPFLRPEQQLDGNKRFMESHAEDYERYEKRAEKLTTTLRGIEDLLNTDCSDVSLQSEQMRALVKEAKATLKQTERLLNTKAGTKYCLEALSEEHEGRKEGKKTFFDLALDFVADGFEGTEQLLTGMMRLIGQAAADKAHTYDFNRLLDSFEQNALRLDMDPKQLHSLVSELKDLQQAKDVESIAVAEQRLKEELKTTEIFDAHQGLGMAFRFAAMGFALANGLNELLSAGDAANVERVQAVIDTLGGAVGVGEFSLRVLGKAGAVEFAEKLSGALGLASAGCDIIGGAQDVFAGNTLEGSGKLTTGAGGAIISFGVLSESFPIVGTVAGGVLIVVGFGLGIAASRTSQANKLERQTKQFLLDAGLSPMLAEQLSNHDGQGRSVGPVLAQVAEYMHVDPLAFVDYLDTLSSDAVRFIVEAAHGVDPDKHNNYPLTGPDVARIMEDSADQLLSGDAGARPKSIEGLALLLIRTGYAPPLPRPSNAF